MHPIFIITTEDIKRLNDEQSRELVARLCRAELSKNGISEAAVTWGGDQRAKDGGVDVRVEVAPPAGMNGYVKKDNCAFQVKAEKFGPSKISGEMAPKSILRPAINELANDTGAYVIVSTRDSLSDSSRLSRVKAMAECLANKGLSGKVVVDFYDCRKLADWVEQHPATANWILSVVGKPLDGWRPYSPWAYQESDIDSEYLVDDRVKVLVPDTEEGIEVSSAINQLRCDLSKNASVRIVGLSGVGKTRLVQALFDKRICTDNPVLDAQNVIYTDLADNPTPQPNAMLEALISENSDCVVVIDNCGQEVHQRLTETVMRHGSKVRLITVEYDIRDDLPEGTICYRLEGSSEDVIKQLLKRRFKILSDSDISKIAEFSDGNARVAYALAFSTETTGELAQLRDSELFRRLFVQKKTESDELLRCAKAASLLYSFDGVDTSSVSELAILARFAEVSVLTFLRHITEMYRRGLVQQRGIWRAVLPHAISNSLAKQAIEELPKDLLINVLVENASDRVARSFSRRLCYLHESKQVRAIVHEWLQPGGRYGDLTSLDKMGREIFVNIAPVHQDAALKALDIATLNPDFVSTDNHNRHHFARIARSLAYEPALFDQAVNVILSFAMVEPEGYKRESSRDMLKSLFYCHLSGTEARSAQRSNVVRNLILSNNEKMQKIGFVLLDAALEAWHFSSHYDFSFGARKRGYGWGPRTHDDVREWYAPFIEIAVEVGKSLSESGRQARVILGESVRALWVKAGLINAIISAANELLPVDGWPEGWLGIRKILQYDKDSLCEESLHKTLELEQLLAPRELKAKIGAKVLARGSFADDVDEVGDNDEPPITRHYRAAQVAEDLGKAAAIEEALLAELLPDLVCGSTNSKIYSFGFGVGQAIQSPTDLVSKVRQILASAQKGTVSLTFLRGVISGWHITSPKDVSLFLDKVLTDEVLGQWLPDLQVQVGLNNLAYARLLQSLELGKSQIGLYSCLGYGRATDPFDVNQIATIVDKIASRPEGGLAVAINLLHMVIYSANEKDYNYKSNLAAYSTVFLKNINWEQIQDVHDHLDYDIGEILEFVLQANMSPDAASEILNNLVRSERSESRLFSYGVGKLLAPFFKYFPEQTLDAIYVADESGEFHTALRIVSRLDNDRNETAIRCVPTETLIKWCEMSPEDRYLFAAQTCRLFAKTVNGANGTSSDIVLSDVATHVLAGAKNKQLVLDIFVDRFQPSGWTGSLTAILRERIHLLAQLNPTGDEKLQTEIELAETRLRKQIEVEEEREENRERRQTGSFE